MTNGLDNPFRLPRHSPFPPSINRRRIDHFVPIRANSTGSSPQTRSFVACTRTPQPKPCSERWCPPISRGLDTCSRMTKTPAHRQFLTQSQKTCQPSSLPPPSPQTPTQTVPDAKPENMPTFTTLPPPSTPYSHLHHPLRPMTRAASGYRRGLQSESRGATAPLYLARLQIIFRRAITADKHR